MTVVHLRRPRPLVNVFRVPKSLQRHFIGRKNQATGERTESIIRSVLNGMGLVLVEKVNTPWKVLWKNKRPVHAFPLSKVSGDFRAVDPANGRSVLVEVKSPEDRNLRWSDLQPHQVDALNTHHQAGGWSLLAWVRDMDVMLKEWPVPGFGPGKSLDFHQTWTEWEEKNGRNPQS